ncbi:hypothetical protein [Mycoplasma sp. 1654_15]|uniref:hypothetical protein n=1 Tax=Mycoplasma sp. 1654_15 TaxID=2725994 RepID=UPI001448C33F|nr:hypothetical protein [Mycoplasma sp. 1654_15]QJB71030.1 hypothetical protein HF996_00665 [Mycoplasma sp. 1654_15]
MKKIKLLFLPFVATVGIFSLISCQENFLNPKTPKKEISNRDKPEVKFFLDNVYENLVNNYKYYREKYFFNFYWVPRKSFYFENFDPEKGLVSRREYEEKSKIEDIKDDKLRTEEREKLKKQREENRIYFENSTAVDFYKKIVLKSEKDLKNTNPKIIKPALEDYLKINFPNLNYSDFFKKYNLFYYVDESGDYSGDVRLNQTNLFYFDLVKTQKKLYLIRSNYNPEIINAQYGPPGALISIAVFPKAENIEFANEEDVSAIM